ncbi:uncharacterized protein LOC141599150 [Silene latifolia]|uniref:uncharacterized protein LOC141599150 n=1 Tax=Silene latifolia TaxID=37657 RepID=UPI003D782194
MAHMSLFSGNREIVEIEEELDHGENYRSNNYMKPETKREEKDRRSLASNDGNISSLEEDLNQLFEIFNRKASSRGSSLENKASKSKKNASKKPVKAAVLNSPGHGISERMNLKQALRGLCLSQASEMAAMKRSTKSPRSLQDGKILTMYRNVAVEDIRSDHSQDDTRESMLEISLVPEESTFDSFQSVPGKLPASDLWPSNRRSFSEKAGGPTTIQNDRFVESMDSSQSVTGKLPASDLWPSNRRSFAEESSGPTTIQNDMFVESMDSINQISKSEKPSCVASLSSSHADYIQSVDHTILTQNSVISTSTKIGNQTSASVLPPSSPLSAKNSMREVAKSSPIPNLDHTILTQKSVITTSTKIGSQTSASTLPPSSPPSAKNTVREVAKSSPIPNMDHTILTQKSVITTSPKIRSQTSPSALPPSSPPSAKNSVREVARSSPRENGKSSAFVDFASQSSLTDLSQAGNDATPTSSSRSSYARKLAAQKDLAASIVESGMHKSMINMFHHEEDEYGQSSDDVHDKAWGHNNSRTTENEKFSSSADFSSQPPLTESLHNEKHKPRCSPRASAKTSLDNARKMAEQKEIISLSPVARNQKKIDMAHKEERAPTRSPRRSDLGDRVLDHGKSSGSPIRVVGKESASEKVVAKELDGVVQDSLKTITSTSSPKGKKVSRTAKNAHHFVKPLIKTKNFVNRRSKKKMATDNGSKNIRSEFHNDLYSSPNPIVCPNCQCDVTDAWKEANNESSLSHHDSPVSPQESLVSVEESPAFYQESPISPFATSDFNTPGPSSDGLMKTKSVLVESSSNSKSRDRANFTQSSKSSPDECSSSTSVSEESNMGRASICDRPHMSKDVRWEAIRHVRFQHGTLGLKNFSLLKKLGCGDIGTVYLAELIGTTCLFAIKVMDCEFLARRKKIARAQTEKDILRMLDHPFLPTLYCQFTSDNLSCLVMEYCPGGDLHVLRQRQPGRCFTEQAARFYVAEVLLALEYLHMLGVVYRDLKPENILVREDGHIMLSDFDLSLRCVVSPTLLVSSSTSDGSRKTSRDARVRGNSRCAQPLCIEPSCQVTCFTPKLLKNSSKLKKVKSDVAAEMRPLLQLVAEPTSARSNSFVGTHEYLAPEIIKGEGHGSAVDWWTFGIFLYELLYGRTPFKGPGNEETLANVVLQNLKFPDSPFVSLQARDLIDALLVKEPENRLGTERGAAEIKQHPFFEGLNWALIRCALPPELPESRGYGMPIPPTNEKSNKYAGNSSEFEVF